jgi:hypothetical protein
VRLTIQFLRALHRGGEGCSPYDGHPPDAHPIEPLFPATYGIIKVDDPAKGLKESNCEERETTFLVLTILFYNIFSSIQASPKHASELTTKPHFYGFLRDHQRFYFITMKN